MPKLTGLLTDWLSIGTSGPTVDGRVIKPEWLTDVSETYDPAEYTAVANAEHWFGNYGSVRELRTIQDKKNRTVLQARIRPNASYLAQNAESRRLFFSMELTHNFAKTGRVYLTGLATTDTPASLGTSEAHFSRTDNDEVFRGGSEEFSTDALQVHEEPKTELIPAIVAAVKDIFTSKGERPFAPTSNQEDFTMTEAQFNTFSEGQKAMSDSLASLVTLLTPATEPSTAAPTAAPAAGSEAPQSDFAVLEAGIAKLNGAIEGLSANFKKAAEGKFGTKVPASEGSETDAEFV